MPPSYADVVFPPGTSRAFTYRVPASWPIPPGVGQWVLAPFGPRLKPGMIVSLANDAKQVAVPPGRIRELSTRLDPSSPWNLDARLIGLAQWMADYYLAPVGVCLALVHPPQPPFRNVTRWTVTPRGRQHLPTIRTGTAAHTILTALAKRPNGLAPTTIDRLPNNPASALPRLKRQQWIQEHQNWSERPWPTDDAASITDDAVLFSDDATSLLDAALLSDDTASLPTHADRAAQAAPASYTHESLEPMPAWWDKFHAHLRDTRFGEILTGESPCGPSVPLARVAHATATHRRAMLVITPNVGRAVRLAAHLRRAVTYPVGEFHGGLSDAQRRHQWHAVKQGRYAIVVGTRRALFLPLPTLGCVWIDHEEDSAYKEEAGPHYHARDVARQRATLDDAVLLLHSPHPSLETIYRCATDNERHEAGETTAAETATAEAGTSSASTTTETVATPTSAGRNIPPAIQLINLQETVFGTIFSDVMRHGITHALEQGGGVIVYHNRKGFSSSLTCRDCGAAPSCPRCQVTFGLRQSGLLCHYCGRNEPAPETCPSCGGTRLEPFGSGTERLEAALRRLYPDTTIGRYDGDTITSDAAARRTGEQFAQGTIPILIGTQMLFHAAPLAPVRYLGVPYADAGLHMPDFRAAERVFHHLQQAVALLTPALEGTAVIQTRLPAHPVMHAVSQRQPALFYDQELALRHTAGYPPFGHLIQLHVSGARAGTAEDVAHLWRRHLDTELARMIARGETVTPQHDAILGPLTAHGPATRGRHRCHLLVKFTDAAAGRTLVRRTLATMTQDPTTRHTRLDINVDPSEMW